MLFMIRSFLVYGKENVLGFLKIYLFFQNGLPELGFEGPRITGSHDGKQLDSLKI